MTASKLRTDSIPLVVLWSGERAGEGSQVTLLLRGDLGLAILHLEDEEADKSGHAHAAEGKVWLTDLCAQSVALQEEPQVRVEL
jgi:hypothetical protein